MATGRKGEIVFMVAGLDLGYLVRMALSIPTRKSRRGPVPISPGFLMSKARRASADANLPFWQISPLNSM